MGLIYLIQGTDVSGAERMHAALIGSDPDALVACPPGSSSEAFAKALGADVVALPFRPMRHSAGVVEGLRSVVRGFRSALDLRRILAARPERTTVFCTSIRPGMLAALASFGLGRSLLWCIPDFLPPPPLRAVVRLMLRRSAARVLCLSVAIEDDLCGRSPRLRGISEVVHPGVDLDRFQLSASTAPERAAIVGHISRVKRTETAIEVAAAVARSRPDFRLRVVGSAQFRAEDFELERRLRARVAADTALASTVTFAGHAGDVSEALSGCGLLLHARPDEPFGIALIEAMAMGLAVVAPAAAGPLEIVEDGTTGILYRPNDAGAAAEAVLSLLGDPERARSMGLAGRRRVEERFTISRQLAETRALLNH